MAVHYLSFSAEINPTTTEHLLVTLGNLHNQGATEVHLMLSTPGGNVMNGMNIYNVARALPFKLVTYNVGNVDSIGNVIFLAGKERYACQHSTFMFHGVGFDVAGGLRLEEKNLTESLDSIQADHKRIASIFEQRSNLDADKAVQLFAEARTKDAGWALAEGVIHAVREPNVPVGVPVIGFVFNR